MVIVVFLLMTGMIGLDIFTKRRNAINYNIKLQGEHKGLIKSLVRTY